MSLHCRTRSIVALAAALAVGGLTALPTAAEPVDGLRLAAGSGLLVGEPWPRWQGRLGLSTVVAATPALGAYGVEPGAGRGLPYGMSLLGDYYFLQDASTDPRYGGGFRATGGLILGSRHGAWALPPGSLATLGSGFAAGHRSVPLWGPPGSDDDEGLGRSATYLGVGYTGLGSLRAQGGWGFSADLGVMALRPRSAVRLGHQSLADTLRALDLAPTLQLGVSYSF